MITSGAKLALYRAPENRAVVSTTWVQCRIPHAAAGSWMQRRSRATLAPISLTSFFSHTACAWRSVDRAHSYRYSYPDAWSEEEDVDR